MSESILLHNVGPIEHLEIPVPEDGGVVVLRGKNGSGKSHAIAGVQSLADQNVRKNLVNRDGSREGTIEGLGVRVRLGRSNTAKGQLAVESLDSVLDPSVLVDPGLKSPELCDQRRVHVLARLANLSITREEWLALLGEHAETAGIAASDLTGSDPIETADKLRRRLHEKARAIESEIAQIQARADIAGEGVTEEATGDPEDTKPLHDALHHASVEYQLLLQRSIDRQRAVERIESLQKQIAQAAKVDIAPIREKRAAAFAEVESWQQEVDSLDEQIKALYGDLAKAKEQAGRAFEELQRIDRAIVDAMKTNEAVDKLHQEASAALPDEIPTSRIEAAEKLVADARAAIEAAVVRNEARDRRAKWERLVSQATAKQQVAESLRNLARSTDSVIEEAFAKRGFKDISIDGGRLCVRTDRGLEPVSELSHGERWRLALDVASRGLGCGAVVAVSQEAWESLDPDNRQHIALLAKERGIVLLTAEASDGELRAEVV